MEVDQFSIDIMDPTGDITSDLIIKVLQDAGFDVLGGQWKATWTVQGYMEGMPPVASD